MKTLTTRAKLIKAIMAYAKQGEDDDGTDILSALVNVVDTARERRDLFNERTQAEREKEIAEFLLGHNNG